MNGTYDITLKGKTGFRITNPNYPVVINDERGIPFFDNTYMPLKANEFNLPAGNYTVVSGKFKEMAKPLEYDLAPLPPPVRDLKKNPERFKIEVIDNPAKCSVDWKNEKLYFDRNICDMPLPALDWILYHECGHRFYGMKKPINRAMTPKEKQLYDFFEMCCDRYACNRMLEEGYNPSQIGEGVISTDLKSSERTATMVNTLITNLDHLDHLDQGGFDNCQDECQCMVDHLSFNETPTADWECIDWVIWHKDMLDAFQDGRLATFDFEKALLETNRVFAIHWKDSAGWSKKFWNTCGWNETFYKYFKQIGYTDHISFLSDVAATYKGIADSTLDTAKTFYEGLGKGVSGIGKGIGNAGEGLGQGLSNAGKTVSILGYAMPIIPIVIGIIVLIFILKSKL